ncbi:MAG: rhomboid family intramembrane serine protease, partial [Gemmatimonadota bacterium]|nr:rhomboid family intramembrane serine protease [Gemmatimonadota bacterium]
MSYRTSYGFDSFGLGLRPTPMVKRLLIANTAVFALGLVIALVFPGVRGQSFMIEWFGLKPSNLVFHPWGPFTYMFVHAGLGHLFFNMLMLFFFGPSLEAKWGEREFLKFYVICGLGGAVMSVV